jgi:Mycotoxin biosynthesis protein UstYa
MSLAAAALDGAIQYERRRLFRPLDTEFTGEARPEIDAAFARLLEPMTIRITPEEYAIANLPGESLQLLDGSGYIGELVVYHELHCIKRIRRHLNLTYYYPDLSGEDIERENVHIGNNIFYFLYFIRLIVCQGLPLTYIYQDHCLEYWRAAAMCRGDTTITTYFWRDRLPTSRSYSDHECVNWELLDNWARSRMISMDNLDILVSFPKNTCI